MGIYQPEAGILAQAHHDGLVALAAALEKGLMAIAEALKPQIELSEASEQAGIEPFVHQRPVVHQWDTKKCLWCEDTMGASRYCGECGDYEPCCVKGHCVECGRYT